MSIRNLAKQAALHVPPVRRLYQAVLHESEANRMLRNELARAEEQQSQLRHQCEQAISDAESRRAEAETKLRTDYEQCMANSEELRARLQESELRREQIDLGMQDQAKLISGLEATIAYQRTHFAEYARILGGVGVLSSEVNGLRRLLCSAQNGSGDNQTILLLRALFLDLLEKAVCGSLYDDASITPGSAGTYDPETRFIGHDWPSHAPTMIGLARLRNIRVLVERILESSVTGDLLEAGVWRGGACIYMRGVLAAYGIQDRKVFAADSFAGLPPPDAERYPADAGDRHYTHAELAVPLERVKAYFSSFGMLDHQVVFLPGFFRDTLPVAPVERLALLRLDGDMYGSTMETLNALYAKVSPGGFVIIDDYVLGPCRKAVTDFREANGTTEPLQDVDGAAVFWQKAAPSQ